MDAMITGGSLEAKLRNEHKAERSILQMPHNRFEKENDKTEFWQREKKILGLTWAKMARALIAYTCT